MLRLKKGYGRTTHPVAKRTYGKLSGQKYTIFGKRNLFGQPKTKRRLDHEQHLKEGKETIKRIRTEIET